MCKLLVDPVVKVVAELPLSQYVRTLVRGCSRAERLACGVALLLCACGAALAGYYCVLIVRADDEDAAPAEWFLTRKDWISAPFNGSASTAPYDPVRLVVVDHSVGHECNTFLTCAGMMRALQNYFLESGHDLPYNFVIANDGRVYEGRGWGKQGYHKSRLDPCSVDIGFVGDYREGFTPLTSQQLNRTRMLLAEGVREGHLHAEYVVLGGCDVRGTESPGSVLYDEIRTWSHYDRDARFRDLTCQQIHFPAEQSDDDNSDGGGDDDSVDGDGCDDGSGSVPQTSSPWYVPRACWRAQEVDVGEKVGLHEPVSLVVVHHTVTRECGSISSCSGAVRDLQAWSLMQHQDIPYNFLVGNDGRVYEARGWGEDGARSHRLTLCSLSIGFIGDYRGTEATHSRVTREQLDHTLQLLSDGVRDGHLCADYVLVAARDVFDTESPGSALYDALHALPQYDRTHRYDMNTTCDNVAEAC